MPPISAAIRPNLEEPDEGEGDREHYLQGQKGLLPEKVMLMLSFADREGQGDIRSLSVGS